MNSPTKMFDKWGLGVGGNYVCCPVIVVFLRDLEEQRSGERV